MTCRKSKDFPPLPLSLSCSAEARFERRSTRDGVIRIHPRRLGRGSDRGVGVVYWHRDEN